MKKTAKLQKQPPPLPSPGVPGEENKLPSPGVSGEGHHSVRDLADDIARQEAVLRLGGGAAGQERQRKLGRLTARERVKYLLDVDAAFLEIGLWAAWEMYPEAGGAVAAGVVTGVGTVAGRACMVIANDAAVKAGAFFPATCKKVLRAQKIAARCNLPLIYLVDSSGVYLPMQDEIFPDEDDFGRIFRNNAVLSAAGIPQYAAIMGNCVAGGAYLPVLCDKLLMTQGSKLYLGGPDLVKAAIGQQADAEDLGGAAMHAAISGTIDFQEKDDESCLHRLRLLMELLPPDRAAPRGREPEDKADSLYDLVGVDGKKEYDARKLLACIVDGSSMQEYKAEYGKTIVCAYAAVGGTKVGVVASQHVRCRTGSGEFQIGGVIYGDSADKAARFIMDCSQSGLPLVFFQDALGFMVGRDAEHGGILRSGAKLVNAVSNATVAKITVIVGGSFGAGNYALCGKAFDPAFIFAWPTARYAVMGPEQAAGTLLSMQRRRRESGGTSLAPTELEELRRQVTADYVRKMDIRYGAARGWVDAILSPQQTRDVLIQALGVAVRPPPAGGFRAGILQV